MVCPDILAQAKQNGKNVKLDNLVKERIRMFAPQAFSEEQTDEKPWPKDESESLPEPEPDIEPDLRRGGWVRRYNERRLTEWWLK